MDAELARRLEEDTPALRAWGKFVTDNVRTRTLQKIPPDERSSFFRLPTDPRIKSISSLIDKALYRGKQYARPYEDIDDKVGVRFVVLLHSDVELVEQALCTCNRWTFEKIEEQDYRVKRDDNPQLFEYESLHYVVRPSEIRVMHGVTVDLSTFCEVQIRTLLQHAQAELTHDTLYKGKTAASPNVIRISARAIALTETTDELFMQVKKKISEVERKQKHIMLDLYNFYERVIGERPVVTRVNDMLLDALKDKMRRLDFSDLQHFIECHEYIIALIKQRGGESLFYKQPVVFLVYFLADRHPHWIKREWPIRQEPLRQVFTDLGRSYDSV